MPALRPRRRECISLGLESLERRQLLAALICPDRLQFTDVDGDRVTVMVSRGELSTQNFTFVPSGVGEELRVIKLGFDDGGGPPEPIVAAMSALEPTQFAGANVAIKVNKRPGGDGLVNVGLLDAAGIDLGNVRVQGDLGRIVVGDDDGSTLALHSLLVNSFGRSIEATAIEFESFSESRGSIGSIRVISDFDGAMLNVMAGGFGGPLRLAFAAADEVDETLPPGSIGVLHIGGSIVGGDGFQSSSIHAAGDIQKIFIDGNIRGGGGSDSAQLTAGGAIGELYVGGSVLGGTGFQSGAVYAGAQIADAQIKRDVRGGAGEGSGVIAAPVIDRLRIEGSLRGGDGDASGRVNVFVPDFFLAPFFPPLQEPRLGNIRVGQDIRGGIGERSGAIFGRELHSLFVGRDIVSGVGEGSGSVRARTIGDVLVLGSLKGSAEHRVEIAATGQVGVELRTEIRIETRTIMVVIELPDGTIVEETRTIEVMVPVLVEVLVRAPARLDSLTVLGKVEHAQILAGVNGSVGSVFVAGDWIASDLAAGVDAGDDGRFGTSDDALMFSPELPPLNSGRIKQVAILGRIKGTPTAGDHFGFVAHRIDRFFTLLGGGLLNLRPGDGNDDRPLGGTSDVRLRELKADEENQPVSSGGLSSSISSIRC